MNATTGNPHTGGFVIETTAIGPQYLVPGVKPRSVRDMLEWRMQMPMGPRRRAAQQRPCNIGLFDEDARNQLSLF